MEKQGQIGVAFGELKELEFAWPRLLGWWLKAVSSPSVVKFLVCVAGSLVSKHPHQAVPGGLGGIQQALVNLKGGKASALK
jgi:hypothetical protein